MPTFWTGALPMHGSNQYENHTHVRACCARTTTCTRSCGMNLKKKKTKQVKFKRSIICIVRNGVHRRADPRWNRFTLTTFLCYAFDTIHDIGSGRCEPTKKTEHKWIFNDLELKIDLIGCRLWLVFTHISATRISNTFRWYTQCPLSIHTQITIIDKRNLLIAAQINFFLFEI